MGALAVPAPRRAGDPEGSRKQGRGRKDGLAAQEEVVDLEEAQKSCPECGLALEALGWTEDAEVAEIEVRAHRRVIRRRKYKAACRCGVLPGIVTAPAPARLIPKGKLGISVWVEILLEKFDHCRPTHRLLQQWRDHGLTLSAGTVAGGLKKLQGLFLPVAEAIAQQQLTQENSSRRDRLAGVCGGGRQKTALAFVGVFVGLHSRVPAPTQSLVCSASISLRQRPGHFTHRSISCL